MSDVKKTLPPSVGANRGISDILDSCGSQLELLEQQARAACLRLAVSTADERGMELWERELGLDVRSDIPLEARRTLLRIALEQMDTCTPEKLKTMLGQMLEGEFTLTERFSEYGVDLWVEVSRFLLPSMRQVENALRRAMPAHLDLHLTAVGRGEVSNNIQRVLIPGMKVTIYTEEEIT